MKRFLALIQLLFAGFLLSVQAQNVTLYTSKQGLSNSYIRSLYEDSRHNIWMTTQNGLNRFDGVKMNVYRHEQNDSTSLLNDESTCVLEFDKNCLLVGTAGGLQSYDYSTNRFRLVPFLSPRGDTLAPRILNINKVEKNRFIISSDGFGTAELKVKADGSMEARVTNAFNQGEPSISPYFIYEDRRNQQWIVNGSHLLFRANRKGGKAYEGLQGVVKLCESSSGKLYAATSTDGIFVYDAKADTFTRVASGEELGGVVYGFNPWVSGRLFICSDGGGLRIYDEKTGKVSLSSIMVKDFDLATSNAKDAISDAYGNVWVGIYRKGVMMKPVNQSAFEYIGQNSITKNTIGSNSIFNIANSRDGLWVAADNDGLYLISADGTTSQHWVKGPQHPNMPISFTAICELPSTVTPSPSSQPPLLLGTYSEGLWKMENGAFRLVTKEIDRVFDIQPAAEPRCYWIATMGGGFFYYNDDTGKFVQYYPDWSKGESGARIIRNPYVYAILPFGNRLFVGTADGLAICQVEPGSVIQETSTKLLTGEYVRHMTVSEDGSILWIATNFGLVRMDATSLEMQTYTTANGLPVNSLASLCLVGNKLWIGTDFGLSCMDVSSATFTNFYFDDGLQDNEFSRGAVVRKDNTLYFSGIGGITYFDIRKMEQWRQKGRTIDLKFVDIFVGNRTIHVGDQSEGYDMLTGLIDEYPHIEMGHSDNHFTIELCVPGFNNQHVVYEYCVNGGPWQEQASSNSRIVFDNLESGTYKIRFRARVMGSLSQERELVAVIHPVWYASTWAKIVYLILFLLACWMVYEFVRRRVQARRVVARHRQREELNEARIQFFMNISHEIRTPMTLILAPLQKLISTDKDPERQHEYKLIQQNSKRILRLINQMMDVRKIEQGKFLLNYKRVELVGFIQNIFDVFTTNAQSRDITYQFKHNVDHLDVYLDGENADKIVMNLLSNAFKFTPDHGTITIELNHEEENPSQFTLIVTDSGVGIKDEDKPKVFQRFYSANHQNGYIGTGIGLHLTSMLVKLHKGTIDLADNPEGSGTQFVIHMPVGNESDMVSQETPAVSSGEQEPIQQALPTEQTDEKLDEENLLSIEKPSNSHRRRALLVEDDEAIRQYVHSELSKELVIQTFSNGQEAWDYLIAHSNKVDVVISDIMMPVMDGMTLCQKIKSNFNTNHIPVVLMTALGSDADRIAGLTNGADAYITKPFNIDILRSTILQLLKSRQLLQGKFHGDKQQEERIDKVELESPDEHLMRRVMRVINENMSNPDLSVEIIADKVGISRVHFYRKMKDLTGQAPRDYLKYVRLKEAARLLSAKKLDITGVSIATGFKSLSAFSTNFKALFGLSPTEWMKKDDVPEDTPPEEEL